MIPSNSTLALTRSWSSTWFEPLRPGWRQQEHTWPECPLPHGWTTATRRHTCPTAPCSGGRTCSRDPEWVLHGWSRLLTWGRSRRQLWDSPPSCTCTARPCGSRWTLL